jgi:hypothetical protein
MHPKIGRPMGKYRAFLAVLMGILLLLSSGIVWLNRDRIIENEDFFTLSIGDVPEIDAVAWQLRVRGLVGTELDIGLDELKAMPKTVQVSTLKCVEGPFGTAEWGGVPLSHVLTLAGVSSGAVDVVFVSADGFTTSLTLEDSFADGVILAYEMNGEQLPAGQGYPVRLVAPEKYGYKWAKWITEIDLVEYDHLGFWESRGWDDDATITGLGDWGWHAALLSLSAVLCGLACVTGFKFSPKENFWTDLPDFVSVKFHIVVSKAYFLLYLPVFALWARTTLENRGGLFYSGHGTLALIVLILSAASMATGALASRNPRRFSGLHLATSTLCFFILVGAIATGLLLVTGI